MDQLQFSKAFNIAKKDLQACYSADGIIAGTHHFTDYWARDGFFAAFGALKLGDKEIVGKMIDLFFSFMRSDGLLPYRIMRGPVSLKKYLGKPDFYDTPRPTCKLRGFGQDVFDGTTLTVLFAALTKSEKYLDQIKTLLNYLEKKNGLLWDGVMGEWMDSIWKSGNLLYSNIIYWYMYDILSEWVLNFDQKWGKQLKIKQDDIGKNIRAKLWNGKYFADWYDFKRQDYFYPFGNFLAIAWGFTTDEEAKLILNNVEDVKVDENENELKNAKNVGASFGLDCNDPKYPWYRVDLFNRLIGMGDYQNKSIIWWQPVLSYVMALEKVGDFKTANLYKEEIVKKILTDKSVYECFERDGKPVKRLFYQAEHPFAWASGMIVNVLS